jgi:hypothetical protein
LIEENKGKLLLRNEDIPEGKIFCSFEILDVKNPYFINNAWTFSNEACKYLETSEKLEFKNIEYEIDQFKARLSNINLDSYISNENHIFNLIDKLVNMRRSVYSKTYMLKLLKDIKEILEKIMNAYSKGYLLKVGLFPRY